MRRSSSLRFWLPHGTATFSGFIRDGGAEVFGYGLGSRGLGAKSDTVPTELIRILFSENLGLCRRVRDNLPGAGPQPRFCCSIPRVRSP